MKKKDEIKKKIGKSLQYIEDRLILINVSPEIKDKLQKKETTLETVKNLEKIKKIHYFIADHRHHRICGLAETDKSGICDGDSGKSYSLPDRFYHRNRRI